MKVSVAKLWSIASLLRMEAPFRAIWSMRPVRQMMLSGARKSFSAQEKAIQNDLNNELSELVEDLKNFGIASAPMSYFSDLPPLSEFQREFEELLAEEQAHPHERKTKAFIQRLVDEDYDFARTEEPIFKLVTNRQIASVCAAYLGLVPKLSSLKVWQSHFTGELERTMSQQWHRDFNEKQMVRVFFYFDDVSAENGAGQYLRGTHYLSEDFGQLNGVGYMTDEDVSKVFNLAERTATAEGPGGTVVFMDTAGLHRGGYHPAPGSRKVSLVTYSTAADLMPVEVRLPRETHRKLDPFLREVIASV